MMWRSWCRAGRRCGARPHRGERVPRVCRRRIGERAGRVRQQAPADHAGHADPHRPRQPGFHQRGAGQRAARAARGSGRLPPASGRGHRQRSADQSRRQPDGGGRPGPVGLALRPGLGPQRSRAARLRRTGRAEHPRGRRPDHSRQHQRRLRPAAVHARRSRLVPVRVAQCAEQRQHAVRRRYRDSHRRRVAGQGHRVPQGRRAELRPAGRGRHLPKGIALPVAVELAGNYVLPAGWCWARTCTTATARWPGAPARCRRPT